MERGQIVSQRYEIVRAIGHGSMGDVYCARDRERERTVALKTLRSIDPYEIYRLKKEFRTMCALRHRNLIELYDLTVDDEHCFFTMELIEGLDLVRYVRGNSGTLDAERVRSCLPQLVDGLAALHGAGTLHRDVKPSNVLVDQDGRVVLLDFGLASQIDSKQSRDSRHGVLVGTLAYMAPEQAWGEVELTPAADWYSVGTVLYESLTGRLPYDMERLRSLFDNRSLPEASPTELCPEAPADLSLLAMELLDPSPTSRPSQQEILARVQRAVEPGDAWTPVARRDREPVGRSDEVEMLCSALDSSVNSGFTTVLVEGLSGVGMSTVLDSFAARAESDRDALVLRTRCHPREMVPFKALDGIIDALARHLAHLSDERRLALLPRQFAALAKLFPVLAPSHDTSRVSAGTTELSPDELRRRAFDALRELLVRVAEAQPLVLLIDDFHWGDRDSVQLLQHLMGGIAAPHLLLVVGAHREGDEGVRLVDLLIERISEIGLTLSRIELAPLPDAAIAEVIARGLGEASPEDAPWINGVLQEAAGLPSQALHLARFIRSQTQAAGALDLAQGVATIIERRILGLPAPARRLIEVLALATSPLPERVALRASESSGEVEEALSLLLAEQFVRSIPSRGGASLAVYHEGIRAAVVRHAPEEQRPALHRRIAEALESGPHPDVDCVVEHWFGAGEAERAAERAARGADSAFEGFAFLRAASLYRRASEIGGCSREPWRLEAQLGDALANAGAGSEAAAAFLRAARGVEQIDRTNLEAQRLRRRAAEQLMRAGQYDDGLGIMMEVLTSVNVPYARSPRRAFASILLNRARLAWQRRRGFDGPERPMSELDRERIETLWSTGVGMSLFDSLRAADFQARHALLAQRMGNPDHMSKSLATEALVLTWEGGARNIRKGALLRAESERLARIHSDPGVRVHALMMDGAAALFGRRFREVLRLCERGEQIAIEHGRDGGWELANLHHMEGNALIGLGEVRRLRERAQGHSLAAIGRGDRYAELLLTIGLINLRWLVSDEVDRAVEQTDKVLADCGENAVSMYQGLFGLAQIDLYRGDGEAALARMTQSLPRVRSAMLMRLQSVRIDMLDMTCRCALRAAWDTTGSTRARHANTARSVLRRLEGEGIAWVDSHVDCLRASLRLLDGNSDEAVRNLEASALGFDRLEMRLAGAVTRSRLAALIGGDAGRELADSEGRWMREQGIVDPDRMLSLLVPMRI